MKNKILLIIFACFIGFFAGAIILNISFVQGILLSILSFIVGFLIPILYSYNTLMNNSGKKGSFFKPISYKNSSSITLWIGVTFCIIFLVNGLKNLVFEIAIHKEMFFNLIGICFGLGMVFSSHITGKKEVN